MLSARVMKNWLAQPPTVPSANAGATAMLTVPFSLCLSPGMNSGVKYRGAFFPCCEAVNDQTDSPPVPVAVGSPACARKSLDTEAIDIMMSCVHAESLGAYH